ncbi:MAG: branched-chain amino acid ABC transporter permease [Burkholderiales bacterium]|nr:branched-chain amino acid ABC transporter permease [Burkholderiales bacterium]
MLTVIVVTSLLLGGAYALMAMGLTLQYGVARILNLSTGETLVGAAFASFWLFTAAKLSPLLTLLVVVPAAFVLNWLIYRYLLTPLVRRAKNRGMLEADSILATFGLLFVMQGLMLAGFGGNYYSYSYLAQPVTLFDHTFGLNRLVAFAIAAAVALGLYLGLSHTRQGMAIRAVAVNPLAAGLVAIDVPRTAGFAFALGGALTACGGSLLSMFLTFNASMGVVFTMKALIIVIMGGVGDIRGAVIAALLLALVETMVASLIDPGLTLAATFLLFVLTLLFRPQGIMGKRA